MTRPIILAPAGTREAVTAAVRCGADAVYLGAKNFNARRNAENLDESSLAETVRFCHERGTQVFVTVNTLVMDSEMPALEETADEIADAGADAVIVQDMAVMGLFARRYPDLPRHASTQTAVHDLYGARYLEDLGYKTIVLARELSLREMEYICSHISARAEAFVHGAHCMSVSGMCYLSAMLGGRSGNRGLCAQPCRLDWRCGGGEYSLSLKDMSLISRLKDMESAGVGVFKIEGRMKRPEYVASAVTACRKAMAGEPWDAEQLRAVFSRSGFTDGYLRGERNADMFGFRTKEDVTGAEKVFRELSALYEKETPRVGVSMAFSMDERGSRLTVSDGERSVTADGPAPEAARSRPTDAAAAEKNLVKTGGTPFYVNQMETDIAPGLMLPASALNALRREALDGLLRLRGEPRRWERRSGAPEAPSPGRTRSEKPALWARFARPDRIPAEESYEKVILPVETLTEELIARFAERLIGELPAVLWPEDEERFARELERLRSLGLREVWGENIYAIPLSREQGLALHGGAGLNALNSAALGRYESDALASVTVSFELGMGAVRALRSRGSLGLMAYGRLPLMRFRNCPVKARIGCAECRGAGELTDRKGVRFPVECGGKKYSTLLNSVPLDIADRDPGGVDHLILWFTRESAEEAAAVTENFKAGRKSARGNTGGLYFRKLL